MSTTLYVRGLPKSLTEAAAEEFFAHFGAEHIRLAKGKLKGTAFVKFPDETVANKTLSSLNGKSLLGNTLVVELAHSTEEEAAKQKTSGSESADKKQQSLLEKKQVSIASNLGIDYPSPPWLEYRYPPPNPAVLENIARTLWSVPKFYEQTLHLMNKMNLPPPFGPPNPTLPGMGPISISRPSFGQPIMAQVPVAPGRMFNASAAPTVVSQSKPNEEEEEDILEPAPKRIKVSETASSEPVVGDYGVQTKKGAFSIKIGKISASVPGAAATQPQGTPDTSALTPSMPATEVTSAAEGRVASAPKLDNPNRKVLTDAEIYVSRLTPKQILEMPRFANYSPGDPTQKLFIKNLAKGVKQEDLEYIFGRYFESDEEMHERLQIKVMTGRHQGGAFVTFPSVEQAQRAIYDIHGFVWKDKPMVIEFGKMTQ